MRSLGRADAGNETANVNTSTENSRAEICMAPQYQNRWTERHLIVNSTRTDERMLRRTLLLWTIGYRQAHRLLARRCEPCARWRGDPSFPLEFSD